MRFQINMQKYLNQIETLIRQRNLFYPLDVLLVGATGTGKSSTINALFNKSVAKVGEGVNPETQNIAEYSLHQFFRLHDSAGLGDGQQADINHQKNISQKLLEVFTPYSDPQEYGFIDLSIVILDGSSRDLGTAAKLLETVILKCIEPSRVCVLINQADLAMKGRYWDEINNCPQKTLNDFLEEQAISIQRRIEEFTGIKIARPVFYSAAKKYNLEQVMQSIINHIPNDRRIIS